MPVPTKSFGGYFHLHDIHRSTDVSNGGKTVECSNTCDSTNYSKEVFTDADSFTVELKVEKLCGGRVHLGLVPADIGHLPTSNYTCGEQEIESSLACVIEPGHVRVLTRDRWVFHGDCNTSDPTVMRFEFTKGALSFSIDDAMLSPAELRKYNVEGRFRLGVSLPKAGQRATLRVVSGGEPSFSTQPTKFHLSGSYVSTELDDDCKTLECVRAFNSTHYSAEVFDARASFAVQLKVDRLNGGAVHFGILDHEVDSAPTSSNSCGDSGLPGSVACVVADGEARIRHRGSYIFRGDTDTSDPILMRLEFHGGKLSFAVDGRNVSSQALRDITFTGRYRIGVSLPKAGQKAVLDSPPVMAVSRSESQTFYDGDFHLQDEYLSTELCNGGKTIDCIRTTDSTNFSREIFSHEDSFTVELKVEKLCGGRVHLGFVPAQVEDFPTSRFTCGEKELYPSLACVIEPGKVRLLTRDRWTFTGSCNISDPTVMRFQFTKGSLSFSIDGVDLPESALQQEVQGSYRLGVSLTTEGQRATLRMAPPGSPGKHKAKSKISIPAVTDSDSDGTSDYDDLSRESTETETSSGSSDHPTPASPPKPSKPSLGDHAGDRMLGRVTSATQVALVEGGKCHWALNSTVRLDDTKAVAQVAQATVLTRHVLALAANTQYACNGCSVGKGSWQRGGKHADPADRFVSSVWHCTECPPSFDLCDRCIDASVGKTHPHGLGSFEWRAGGYYCDLRLQIEETEGLPMVVGLVPAATPPGFGDVMRSGGLLVCLDFAGSGERPSGVPATVPARRVLEARPVQVSVVASADGVVRVLANGAPIASTVKFPCSAPHRLAVAFTARDQRAGLCRRQQAPARGTARRVAGPELLVPLANLMSLRQAPAAAGQCGWVVDVATDATCTLLLDDGTKVVVPIHATTAVKASAATCDAPAAGQRVLRSAAWCEGKQDGYDPAAARSDSEGVVLPGAVAVGKVKVRWAATDQVTCVDASKVTAVPAKGSVVCRDPRHWPHAASVDGYGTGKVTVVAADSVTVLWERTHRPQRHVFTAAVREVQCCRDPVAPLPAPIVESPAPAETTPTPATPHTAAKAAPPSPQKPAPPSTATAASSPPPTAAHAPPVGQPTTTPSAPAAKAPAAKAPAHLNPDSDPHAAENVAVTTPLRIPKSYAFDGDLGAELVKHEALLGLESCCMEDMVEDCMLVATCRVDRLRKQKGSSPLDEREALTMALYTHDVPEVDPHEQFYFVLNDIIHRRDAAKLRALLPFRFVFAAALEKLPVVAEPGGFVELYRGINGVDTDRIRAEYTVGVKVQWTPITSLSLARSVAAMFARDGGVLFIVTAVNARDVRDFSQKQDEQEVILRPDTRFIVTRTVQTSDCLEIYLTEESGAVVKR